MHFYCFTQLVPTYVDKPYDKKQTFTVSPQEASHTVTPVWVLFVRRLHATSAVFTWIAETGVIVYVNRYVKKIRHI